MENDELTKHLLNLLAIIHRDGGHYVSKYGIEKSTGDAIQIVGKLRNLSSEILEDKYVCEVCLINIKNNNRFCEGHTFHETGE